jgi:hypothetical protein
VALAEALAVQVRGELAQLPFEGCTTFVISADGTASGQILIGQNSDVEPELEAFAYVLRLQPEGKPTALLWTFGGMIGYHGLNAVGVAHFANSLGGGPAWQVGLPHYPIKRLMLEQRTVDEVLALLRRVPVCSSANYVCCDGAGRIADVELTPAGFALLEDQGAGFLAHSNHFVCGPYAGPDTDAASVPDSFPRLARLRELLAGRYGRVTVKTSCSPRREAAPTRPGPARPRAGTRLGPEVLSDPQQRTGFRAGARSPVARHSRRARPPGTHRLGCQARGLLLRPAAHVVRAA